MPKPDNAHHLLKKLLDDYQSGKLAYNRIIYDGIVLDIDDDGGRLTEDCPQDSIKVRITSDSYARFYQDDNLNIAWPLLPSHYRPPLKIGESVKILFEYPESVNCWWLPMRHFNDNVNFKPWSDIAKAPESSSDAFGDTEPEDTSVPMSKVTMQTTESTVVQDPHWVKEDVPPFNKGHDEFVEEGSNNSMMRLGRDRPKEVGSGKDAGCSEWIVGRKGKDPSWKDDKGRLALSAASDIDDDLPNPSDVEKAKGKSALANHSQVIRLKADDNIVIWVGDELYISMANGEIKIGGTKTVNEGGKGKLVTANSVCRHMCPFISYALAVPTSDPTTGALTPPPSSFIGDNVTGVVESFFGANGTSADETEANEKVEIVD